jgi:hypothetical protein
MKAMPTMASAMMQLVTFRPQTPLRLIFWT